MQETARAPVRAQQYTIAVGARRTSVTWTHKTYTWEDLVDACSTTHRTRETVEAYHSMSRAEKAEIKDIGGFVGGVLAGGRRLAHAVLQRTLVTLDFDYVDGSAEAFADGVRTALPDTRWLIYSSHSHTPDAPRLRLVVPFLAPIPAEQYAPVARRVAEWVGIDAADDTSYEANRLMYWPSTPSDGEFFHAAGVGAPLDAATVLATYADWRDAATWPTSSRQLHAVAARAEKQQDPTTKPGIIGAWCRAHTMTNILTRVLDGVYTPTIHADRWTLVSGSTVGGLVVYDDKWAYSHHGTDPVSGQLVNAWDMVRLHRFGALDEDASPQTPVNRLPSYQAMTDLALGDAATRKEVGREKLAQAEDEFFGDADPAEEGADDWVASLDLTAKGALASTINNMTLIMTHDPKLKGRLSLDTFAHRAYGRDLPWAQEAGVRDWTDADEAALRLYLERTYAVTGPAKVQDAIQLAFARAGYHPVRDYLDGLVWDGIPRVERLLVEYLGAENDAYTHAVTRVHLAAAVARIYEPGCKYDTMLTLSGPQGIGKSTLIRLLGRDQWYSDNMDTLRGKEAAELIQGVWMVEMGELNATRKSDRDAVKSFLSRSVDIYRVPYGRNTSRFPRQCVFWGTTNEGQYLRDPTGDRRTFPVPCAVTAPTRSVFRDLAGDVDQIWAEAVELYRGGQPLYLSGEMAAEAEARRAAVRERDPKVGLVEAYLERKLPEEWERMNLYERREWLASDAEGTVVRDRVCAAEVLCEVLGHKVGQSTPMDSREVKDILRGIEGWTETTTTRFSLYGRQRAFLRK